MLFFNGIRALISRKTSTETQVPYVKTRSLAGLEALALEDGCFELDLGEEISCWKGLVRSQKAAALAISISDAYSLASLLVITIRDDKDPRALMRVFGELTRLEGGFLDRNGAHMLAEYSLGLKTGGVFAFAYVGSSDWPSSKIGDGLLYIQGFGAGRTDSLRLLKFATSGGLLALTDERYWNRVVLGQGMQLFHCRHSGIINVRLELEEQNAKNSHVVDLDESDDIDAYGLNPLNVGQKDKTRRLFATGS